MKIAIIITVVTLLFFSLFYFLTGYSSAFEADQQCHFDMRNKYSDITSIGCDHDLETRQWILYEERVASEPAKVMQRYRY